MKKKAKNTLLVFLAFSIFSWFIAMPARAGINVLSVPGHPLSLVLDTKGGIIDLALLRSPAGIQKILPLEGFMLKDQTVRTPHADGDLVKDLLWTLDFRGPAGNSRGIQVWVGALSGSKQAWVYLCPVGRTFWDSIPLDLRVPEGFGLYFAPTAPRYGDLPKYAGSRTLGFVYTISLTSEGPRFVPAPQVYKQLQRVADLVRKAEQIPYRKEVYKHMIEDFARLSRGSEPSTAAIRNFAWKRILTLQWR